MEALSIQEGLLTDGFPGIDLSELPTISPIETEALTSLRDILNKTPHDMDKILNWIYVNRKLNYSEFARETIVKQFSSVGYIIPEQSSYTIPEIDSELSYKDFSKIDDIRKNVILNYLGLISQGNNLSIEGKDNIIDAHTISEIEALSEETPKPTMFLEAFDTIMEQQESETEVLYDEDGELKVDENEETIYNIFIEDIIDDPLATYSIATSSKDNKTISTTDLKQASLEDPAEVTTTTEQAVAEAKQPSETTTSSSNTDSGYSLTIQDNDNLEEAYDLSTYVVVASPILAQALAPKLERSRRKVKDIERIK